MSTKTNILGGTERIVFVDDEKALVMIVSEMLIKCGYNLISTTDPFKALQFLTDDKYDLLITDMNMPGMSGGVLASKAKLLNPNLKIIIVSGYSSNEINKQIEIEIDAFIQKPFNLTNLDEKIRRIFDL